MTERDLAQNLHDRWWRINNLYYIQDEQGHEVLFKCNPVQAILYYALHYFNLIPKSRQHGITTFICVMMLDFALFNKGVWCGVIAQGLQQAGIIFAAKIKYPYERLPETLKAQATIETLKDEGSQMIFGNGSKIIVATSLRSGTYQWVHVSEMGPIERFYPLRAREIVSGTLETVHEGGWITIESTSCGPIGYFHKMHLESRKREKLGLEPGKMQYKEHFFAWFMKESNTTDPRFIIVPEEVEKYLDDLSEQIVKDGTWDKPLTQGQRAFYAEKYKLLGDEIYREHPSTIDEAFKSSAAMVFNTSHIANLEKACCDPVERIEFIDISREDGIVEPEPVEVDRLLDFWKVWRKPHHNHSYIVYGDVCEGLASDPKDMDPDSDYHYAGIFDRSTQEVVATYHGRCDTMEYGQQMLMAAIHYNNAWASPEVNSVGLAVLNELKRAGYNNIYQRQGKEEEHVEEGTPKLGLRITALNRKPYLVTLKQVFRDGDIVIYDQGIIDELRVFVNKNGKWQAETGYHDDAVMMLLGLVQLHIQCPFDDGKIHQTSVHHTTDPEAIPEVHQLAVAGAVDTFEDDDEYDY